MIDYETYCKIVQLHQKQLKPTQIARNLSLDLRTVCHWIEEGSYRLRKTPKRSSKLDPYKPQIVRWLEQYPYTGVQILQRLREAGYDGGRSILQEYIAAIRPRKFKAYLTLSFAPGESAQVDWGQYGSVPVGSTQQEIVQKRHRLDAASPELLRHGAVLQPHDVRGVYGTSEHGALPGLPPECLQLLWRRS